MKSHAVRGLESSCKIIGGGIRGKRKTRAATEVPKSSVKNEIFPSNQERG